MAGYDPKKAAEYNKLIQQGVAPEAAIVQAGITYEEQGNYEINSVGTLETNNAYGKMSDIAVPQNNTSGVNPASDPSQFPAYDDDGNLQLGFAINDETGQTYYKGVEPATRDTPVNPASDPSQFPAYDDDGNLQPGFAINDETGDTYYRGVGPLTRDVGVRPQSDPSQFPAYDDDGNLQPGFAINDETGDTYYRGVGPLTQQTAGFNPNYDEFGDLDAAVARQVESTSASTVNDPYYGLTPTQLQDLGGADPTDPYIRARLGIPQLPGSTLFATGGFGTIKTGVPAIDSALGIIGKIPSLFSNFANTVGGLFGPKPTASAAAATTGMSVAGLTTPTPTPPTTDTSVNPASDPSQFPAYDDDGNLQPGFAINDETGGTYYKGLGPATQDTPVNPASNPSQFPAYDDDGNLQPGFAINDETGGTYYQGFERNTDQPVNPASDPSQFPAYDDDGNLQLGFAINDEDGRPYYRGEGPPTQNTEVSNTGISVQLPGGALQFSSQEQLTAWQENPQSFAVQNVGGVNTVVPFPSEPATQNTSVNPASDPSQFPAYDDDGNLQPGFAINDENGGTYYRGFAQPTSNDAVAIDANSGYGSEVGSAPLDVAEVAGLSRDATTVRATNPDLSPEAQANLDGINAANAEIVKAQGNIQSNNLNILRAEEGIADARENQRQAEAIIEQNNAELADPFITDERRAELLENNALQEASIAEQSRYIIDQTDYIVENEANNAQQQDNILTNQVVAEENAAAFRFNDGGELLTVEPNLDPELEQADEEVTVDTTDPTEVAALVDPGLETPVDQEVLTTDNATEVDAEQDPFEQQRLEAEQELNRQELAREATDVEPEQDPFEAARLEAEQNLENAQPDEFAPEEVDAEQDPFEQQRLEAEQELNRQELAREATDVEPGLFTGQTDEFGGVDEAVAIEQADVDSRNDPQLLSEEEIQAELDNQIPTEQAEDVDTNEDDGLKTPDGQEEGGEAADTGLREPTDADAEQANQEAAFRDRAQQQATFQARYKQSGNADWRVRLSLAPDAEYLYNEKSGVGILAPLAATDGVIFPYTPNITTTYSANYEQYDLVHSNYRGLFYKNSRVGDIQIRGTFTAQDTTEADYLLAVIHFFRSATKMFYGATDPQRGVPPPVCLLNGFGQYQFSDHPVVISSFNYTLPNDVDYIRAGSPNNYGINLLNRRAAVASNPGGQSLAGLNRLANALLKKGAPGQGVPDPSAIQQNVSNTAGASYVPTKMEIDITLIPVQTRTQVSKQFNLKGFANGQLLKGGFW